MKLSRTVVYAVQATIQLASAQSDQPVPCRRLAIEGQMPERFLLQILRSLVNHGILHSTRGVDGGYSLDRSPKDISLLEVIEAIEGPLGPILPTAEGKASQRAYARLREAVDEVGANMREQLQAIKLSDLISGTQLARLA
jgi:Rrf2 family protein